MRVHEIISEGAAEVIGMGTSLATVASALGINPTAPWLVKLTTYAPGTISLLSNIATGQGVTAALDGLELALGNAKLLPAEAKQAVNTFSALRSAHGIATSVVGDVGSGLAGVANVAAGAAPLAVMAGATQQAATADMNSDKANVFGSTAKLGKKIGDWANKVTGRDDKYAQMRAQQRADLVAK